MKYILPGFMVLTITPSYSQNQKDLFKEYKEYRKVIKEISIYQKDLSDRLEDLSLLEKEIMEKFAEYNKLNSEKESYKAKISGFSKEREEIVSKIKELEEISKKYPDSKIEEAVKEDIKNLTDQKKALEDSIKVYEDGIKSLEVKIENIRNEGSIKLQEFKKRLGVVREKIRPWKEFYEKLKKK